MTVWQEIETAIKRAIEDGIVLNISEDIIEKRNLRAIFKKKFGDLLDESSPWSVYAMGS